MTPMVTIKGRFADQVRRDYRRICLSTRSLLPMSLRQAAELSGIHESTLSAFLNTKDVLDTRDLARILRVAGLTTADLLIFTWSGQPPSLPIDLETRFQTGTLEAPADNGSEVLTALRQCLQDHKIVLGTIPRALGWETRDRSATVGRYLRGDVPLSWVRLLQILHLVGIEPGAFAEQYLQDSAQARRTYPASATG